MIIRIVDTVPGRGAETQQWDAPASKLTLREIVAERVRGEVLRFNQNRPEIFNGLVAPEESERILNGYRMNRVRELDPEREVTRALRAFESNGFLVFSGGRQIESLDEEVDLAHVSELEFVKLVPIVGG